MITFKTFSEEKHPALKRAGVSGFSKPKRTPSHPKKSHIVVVKDGGKVKTIRFGEQGASTAGDPKKGESERMKKKRSSFKARHAKILQRVKHLLHIGQIKKSGKYKWPRLQIQD